MPTELLGAVGRDQAARQLKGLLSDYAIGCRGLLSVRARTTSVKTRVVAHKQQVVRIDRETRDGLNAAADPPAAEHRAIHDPPHRGGNRGRLWQRRCDPAAAGGNESAFAAATGSGSASIPSRSTTSTCPDSR